LGQRDAAPGPPISGRGGGYVNSFENIKRLKAWVKRLVRKKPYRSLAKATRSCYAELNKCHPQSPPRHARRIIGLGKDVSREQRARHQASLGKESPAPAEENEPQGRKRMKRRKITIIK
jgi:hypothetical protein